MKMNLTKAVKDSCWSYGHVLKLDNLGQLLISQIKGKVDSVLVYI